jgi:N-acetylglucosaminyldiphosphoundecaprenol N-acetyl-beta-D-mannosaminyltransferase
MSTKIQKINFDGIVYYCGESLDFIDFIADKFTNNSNKKTLLVHINLRNYYYLQKDKTLKENIKNHCLSIFEGIGMKAGFFLKGFGILPDSNGTDLVPLVLEKLNSSYSRLFLLGSENETISKTAIYLQKKYPNMNICGYHNGYFSEDEEQKLVEKINESNANLLLVGMGFPLQEKFVLKYKEKLAVNLIWSVGGLFDILSGTKKRSPAFFRNLRLEWLYRLLLEPGRMLHRNTIAAFWSLSHIIFRKRSKSL